MPGVFYSGNQYIAGSRELHWAIIYMSGSAKDLILWLDKRLTELWVKAVSLKDIFIHGKFTYWGFIKNNVHLFLVLGLFGALTGYLNTFIEREVPFNAYAGKLGVHNTPLSVIHAVLSGKSPLSTPFPPADLIFGVACSLLMIVLLSAAILWAAINHMDSDRHAPSEMHLISRVSFVTLFGSLMLVFMSYLIRNYGLLIQALMEIFSVFAALYVLSFVIKRSKNPFLWAAVFIAAGAIIFLFEVYIPVVSIFLIAAGFGSLFLSVLMIPFIIVKRFIGYIKEKHI